MFIIRNKNNEVIYFKGDYLKYIEKLLKKLEVKNNNHSYKNYNINLKGLEAAKIGMKCRVFNNVYKRME